MEVRGGCGRRVSPFMEEYFHFRGPAKRCIQHMYLASYEDERYEYTCGLTRSASEGPISLVIPILHLAAHVSKLV